MKKILWTIIITILITGVAIYIFPIEEVSFNKPITIKVMPTYKIDNKYFKVIRKREIGKCPRGAECLVGSEIENQIIVLDKGIHIVKISTIRKAKVKTKSLVISLSKKKFMT